MTCPGFSPIVAADLAAVVMMGIGAFLATIRLLRGPSLPDRVVALDLLAVMAMGFVASQAILMEQPVLLDAAIVVALIGFLGTTAVARWYLEKGS